MGYESSWILMCLPIRLQRIGKIFVYKISTARRAVCTCVYIQIFFVHNVGEPPRIILILYNRGVTVFAAIFLMVSLTHAGTKCVARNSKIMTRQKRSVYPWSFVQLEGPERHVSLLLRAKC